jgi:kumamolisin
MAFLRSVSRARMLFAALVGLAASSCAPNVPTHGPIAPPALDQAPATKPLTVEAGMRISRDLGPVPGDLTMHLTLGMARRNTGEMEALVAQGKDISRATWLARFAPDPVLGKRLAQRLQAAGMMSEWSPGDTLLTVTASARDVERFFGISIHRFRRPDGMLFHAPLSQPAVPGTMRSIVNGITGFDDYPLDIVHNLRDPAGLSPNDVLRFYDVTPLRNAGLDGAGTVVMFPEWTLPNTDSLNAYAQTFGLTPFNVQTRTDASWGAPQTSSSSTYYDVLGEAQLDLEIVHAIAPAAQEIVYAVGDSSALPAAIQRMTKDHPGQIISSSLGNVVCEAIVSGLISSGQLPATNNVATVDDDAAAATVATNTTYFDASGDSGAYECKGHPNDAGTVSIDPMAASSNLTAVGGTAMLLSSSGGYFKEVAWGEPIEASGGGGGVSTIFPRPTWQQAPGVPANLSGRGIPDISANADSMQSPWHIDEPDANHPNGNDARVGGTSAAAPFWAAITALIDQDLVKRKGLRGVGFANPALYTFAQSPAGLPAPAFHDVTEGSNLHYEAGPGWDMATGLGTPEVAALADDFEWYERAHPSGP